MESSDRLGGRDCHDMDRCHDTWGMDETRIGFDGGDGFGFGSGLEGKYVS